MAPSPTRGKERSLTYLGVAKAMADQWTRAVCPSKGASDLLPA
jgi:hypothetical protein